MLDPMRTAAPSRCLTLVVAAVLLAATAGASGIPAAGAAPLPQADEILGFGVGEEYRYVLGPASSLTRGETGMWSIRLDEILVRDDGSPEGLFALRHEWQAPQPVTDPPLRAITRVTSEGTLRVNAHGFPLFIHYEAVRHLAGYGDEAYTVDYALDEDHRRFDKSTTMDGSRWYQTVDVREHDTVSRKTPAGLFE